MKVRATNSWAACKRKAFICIDSTTAARLSGTRSTQIYSAEWWSTVGQLIERRAIIIPNDEKLIAQLTSHRKLYDSKGREKLESKADLRARGVESPDRADALIGAIVLGAESQIDWKEALMFQKEIKHQMQFDYQRTGRGRPHIEWGW